MTHTSYSAWFICLGLTCLPGAWADSLTHGPVWPAPPAEPRVAYVRSIQSPADLGIKRSMFKRVAAWISGVGSESAQFVKPFYVALDDAGNLLLTDTGANAVCCLDHSRKKWLRWEQAGKIRFQSPVAAARHRDAIYVADSGLGKVLVFSPEGKLRVEITRELERPAGLAIAGDKLFVVDAQRHHVVAFDLRGGFISKFGRRGSKPGEFNFPTHIASDSNGRLFVTDSMNCRIQILDASGQLQRVIGSAGDGPGHFSRPKGVAVDTFGHIYVVDAVFDNIQVFDDQGRLLLNWGESGGAPGQFWLPNGIAISRDNEIYVADSYNRRIQVFRYIGKQ
jgi:hypothetical protein